VILLLLELLNKTNLINQNIRDSEHL